MFILVQLRLSAFHILFVFGADCYDYHHCLLLMRGRKHVYGSVACGPFGEGRLETGQQDCEHLLIYCRVEGQPPSTESERQGPNSGRLLAPHPLPHSPPPCLGTDPSARIWPLCISPAPPWGLSFCPDSNVPAPPFPTHSRIPW